MDRRLFVGSAGAILGLAAAGTAGAAQTTKGQGTKVYSGAGKFSAKGQSGFKWPAQMPNAPRRIRSASVWWLGDAGEARSEGASVEYVDGVNVVVKGPANKKYRLVIVLSDEVEGDWDNLAGETLKEGNP